MTFVDQPTAQAATARTIQEREKRKRRRINVGSRERVASVAAGSILAGLGILRRSVPGLLVAGVGGILIKRGASGHCEMYQTLGVDTARPHEAGRPEDISERGIHIEQSFLINKSPQELYEFWRNFENLPRFMEYLDSVTVTSDRRSHWVARAPHLAGGRVEWDAEITRDEPGSLIAWRSLPGGDVDNVGEIRFSRAMGDRGTEVHVSMDYLPPAGRLGHWVAKLLGEGAPRQIREGLRNFKRIMETGEVPTISGQPHGTCGGIAKGHSE